MSRSFRIAVLGAGAWGTALALAAARDGDEVALWARDPEMVADIRARGENRRRLAGIALPPSLRITDDLAAAVSGAGAVILAVPAQATRDFAAGLKGILDPSVPLVLAAKGIEPDSGKLLIEVAAEVLPGQDLVVLSGPAFARELALNLPTAVTLASDDAAHGPELADRLSGGGLRCYWSDDPIGAQLGGALKNVLAIACGVIAGRDLGENARAALITRGLAEMGRLAAARGARAETLMGLAGLGDLVLTATSGASRNYSLGVRLGRGEGLEQALAASSGVVEGVATAAAAVTLARRLGVEAPVCAAVAAVLTGRLSVDDAIKGLLARPLRPERDDQD